MYSSLHRIVLDIFDHAQPGDFVVFDIDDTVLHGHGRMTQPHNIGMAILREVKKRNIPVYYVTARPESPENRLATYEDLARVGILLPYTMFMRPPHVNNWEKISKFKADSRKLVEGETKGNCLMTIGDQWTDLLVFEDVDDRDEMDLLFSNFYVLFDTHPGRQWGLKLKEPPY
jgi:predicted secreted acid phosphatase